jgi:hypothetical protein
MKEIRWLASQRFETVPDSRWNLYEQWTLLCHSNLEKLTAGWGIFSGVKQDEKQFTCDERNLITLFGMSIPGLNDVRLGAGDISLAKTGVIQVIISLDLHQMATFI